VSVDEGALWPDPEPVDGISMLPPTAEAISAQAAMDNAPDADDAFGADAGERWLEPDGGAEADLDAGG
jgi:hypothetical protein